MSTPNKIKHCQIHLAEPSRTDAAKALFPYAGVPAYDVGADSNRREFHGPHFHDIDGVYNEDGFCVVVLHDGTQYCYPHHTVARIKNYTTDEEPKLKAV